MADETAAPNPTPATAGASGEAEPYQALYRRFRPQRFADILGQEHVTRALRHAVRDGKVAHAYLFSGPRGTGKTTTARVLAMALNCENPDDGEPDGTCPSCVAIRSGSSMDVQELDSASNRGIDEMRDLLSRVALGTPGRWKVYIVDEVHQMTPTAASAMLKTLEEPPAHVIFVLATTDPQKVLETIRSRTQHFEFRLLPADVLAELLRDVVERAKLDVDPEAIDVVVRRGHGSARDALSVLDQVAASGTVVDDAVPIEQIVEAVGVRDPGLALSAVAEAISAGRDPRRLGEGILLHLRNGFLATRAPSLVPLPEDALGPLTEQARRLGAPLLVRAMELIGQALIDMRDAVDPRITLEVALVRLSAPDADDSPGALLERIERLERTVGHGAVPERTIGRGSGPVPATVPLTQASPAPPARPQIPTPPRPQVTPSLPPQMEPSLPPRVETPAQPHLPSPGPKSALGAHRRARPDAGSPAAPAAGHQVAPAAGHQAAPAAGHQVAPAAGHQAASAAGHQAASAAGHQAASDSALQPAAGPTSPAAEPIAAGPLSAPPSSAPLPTREQLTMAWGDQILPGLRPGVKVYLSSGRFVSVDDAGAVFAVPDQGLLSRAGPTVPEVEAALQAHFGRPVPLRLILDSAGGSIRGSAPAAPPPPEDPGDYDLTDLRDAPAAVVSPEQRLLEAFPGAEEIS